MNHAAPLCLGMCLLLSGCASRAAPDAQQPAAVTSGGDGTVARAALGLSFQLPADWTARPPSGSFVGQWQGPANTMFIIGSDPAPDRVAYEQIVAGLRARAAQQRWTISNEQRAPSLGDDALALEVTIEPLLTIVRMATWAALVDGRVAVISCAYESGASQTAQPVCAQIMDSVARAPRAANAPEGFRSVTIGSLSATIPSDWTAAPRGDALLFTSRDATERQIAFSAALSPAETRVTILDADAIRAHLSTNGATVSDVAAQEVNGVPGYRYAVEQPQLRRAGVSQLMLFVHLDRKSIAATCAFRTDDSAGRAQCARAMSSVRRDR